MSDTQQVTQPTPTPPHPGMTWVRSGLTGADKDKVVLSEWDPAHPLNAEGKPEIWVAGADSPPVKVAKTPAVVQHIRDGELVEVAESESAAHKAKFDAEMRERQKAQMEQHPAFATLAGALRQRGMSIHELMTGEPTTQTAPVQPAPGADAGSQPPDAGTGTGTTTTTPAPETTTTTTTQPPKK